MSSLRLCLFICIFVLSAITSSLPTKPSANAPPGPNPALRILLLGDAITSGVKSGDGNGYRLRLQEHLQNANVNFTFVGDSHTGTMENNAHSGFIDKHISQIQDLAQPSLRHLEPDIILIHAGTIDQARNPFHEMPIHGADRLETLVKNVTSTCPDAVVLVAQIVDNAKPDTHNRIRAFNHRLILRMKGINHSGRKVALVDMNSIGVKYVHHEPCTFMRSDDSFSDLADGTHPSDQGYNKMGDIWYRALRKLAKHDWIRGSAHLVEFASEHGDAAPEHGTSEEHKEVQLFTSSDYGDSDHVGVVRPVMFVPLSGFRLPLSQDDYASVMTSMSSTNGLLVLAVVVALAYTVAKLCRSR